MFTGQLRGEFHKTFRNFAQAIHDKDHKLAKKEYKRALGERNEIFMERYLKPWMDIQKERTTVAPALEDMPLPIGTFPTDSEGNHQEFGGFIKYDLEMDSDVLQVVDSIKSSFSSLSKEKQLAALTNLLTNLMDQNGSEAVND